MFSSAHSTSSSGPKYTQNNAAKVYPAPTPTRFSVHVFKKPSLASYLHPPSVKTDIGYRPTSQADPQGQGWFPPARYEDPSKRFSQQPPAAPPSNTSRSYEPPRTRNPVNFNIYPGPSKDTFIYEQSQSSKSDIFSNSDVDSLSTDTFSPAMSTDSTMTLRGPDTPAMPDGTLEATRVERMSTPAPARRNSIIVPGHARSNDQAIVRTTSHSHSSTEGSFQSRDDFLTRAGPAGLQGRSTTPFRMPNTLSSGITNSDVMNRTPSESDVDERERIAVANAQYNATSTASYYTSSPTPSTEQPFQRGHVPSVSNPQTREATRRDSVPQPLFANSYVHNSPDDLHNHCSLQPPVNSAALNTSYIPLPVFDPHVPQVSPYHSSQGNSRLEDFGSSSSYATWDDERNRGAAIQHYPNQQQRASPPSSHPHPDSYSVSTSRQTQAGSSYTRFISTPPESASSKEGERTPVVPPPALTRQNSSFIEHRSSVIGSHANLESSKSSWNSVEAQPAYSRYGDGSMIPPTSSHDQRSPTPNPYYDGEIPRQERKASISGSPISQTSSRGSGSEYKKDSNRRHSVAFDQPQRPALRTADYRAPDIPPQVAGPPPSSVPFAAQSPTSGKHGTEDLHGQSSAMRRESQYVALDQEKTRPRTVSMSYPVRPDLSIPASKQPLPELLPLSNLKISDEFERRPRHPDLSPRGNNVPNPQADSYNRQESRNYDPQSTSYSGGDNTYHRQRLPSISHMADPGSMATTAVTTNNQTRSIPTQEVNLMTSRSRTPYPEPTQRPEPLRRSSDPDRPIHDASMGQHSVPSHERASGSSNQAVQPFPLPEPHRRYSDGDQNAIPKPSSSGRTIAPLIRSVRWNETLICPSPLLPTQRRKGWFNRRGDQLWTNDGVFRAALLNQQYPADLDDYPEQGQGWMNEEGVRIDLEHRRIPKVPLRSALKQPQSRN